MVDFTDRELQVMKRIFVNGWGIPRTAKDLGLSETRIRTLRDRFMRKLAQMP